jgi:hypothetical protein
VPPIANGEKWIYLIIFIALLALLAFTIWREFHSILRPWLR